MDHPLHPAAARQWLRRILACGSVVFTRHAQQEMMKDGLTDRDCFVVLRGGLVEPAEFESGAWRYRVHTSLAYVVVEIDSEVETIVITAWRLR